MTILSVNVTNKHQAIIPAPPATCPSHIQWSFQFTFNTRYSFWSVSIFPFSQVALPLTWVTPALRLVIYHIATLNTLFEVRICPSHCLEDGFLLMIPPWLPVLLFVTSDNVQPAFSLQPHLSQHPPSCQATYILVHDRCHHFSPLSHTLIFWLHQLWRSLY